MTISVNDVYTNRWLLESDSDMKEYIGSIKDKEGIVRSEKINGLIYFLEFVFSKQGLKESTQHRFVTYS
jgi:hypothetical protein